MRSVCICMWLKEGIGVLKIIESILKKWGRVTKRFAKRVNRLTAITTNQEAGWFLGLDDEVVYRIDKEMRMHS